MVQQALPIVAKRVYGLIADSSFFVFLVLSQSAAFRVFGSIAVSGYSRLQSYRGQRLFASTVLSGSAANRGNGKERVIIVGNYF